MRIKYKITNRNSGALTLEGTGVTVSGRGTAESYLTPGLKTKLDNTARVTVTAIAEAKADTAEAKADTTEAKADTTKRRHSRR